MRNSLHKAKKLLQKAMKKNNRTVKDVLNNLNDELDYLDINGIKFYFEPSLIITKDILNEMYLRTLDGRQKSYQVYIDESAGLIIY